MTLLRYASISILVIVTLLISILIFVQRGTPEALKPSLDQATAYVIQSVQVISMDQDQAQENWTVVVRDGVITDVGPDAEITLPSDAEIIDGNGKTLLPGLIDMHVHVYDEADLAAFLSHGVTTVRNNSGMPFHLTMQDQIENGRILGPRLFTSGPILNEIGGRNVNELQQLVDGPMEARAAVRQQYDQGFRSIKLYSNLSIASYEAILDEAAELNMPVFGHPVEGLPPADQPYGREPFDHVLDDNLVTLEHMESIVWHALNDEMDEDKARNLARRIAAAGIAVDPTLTVHQNLTALIRTAGAHAERDEMDMFNPLVFLVEAGTYDFWASYEGNDREQLNDFYRRCVQIFHEEGVKLVVGTDAQAMVTLPGSSVIRELELFVQAGLSPFEALRSATIIPAELLGLEGKTGMIQTGYRADLILVEGNPLNDVSVLEHPTGVMLNGVWLDQADLDDLHEAARHPSLLRTVRRVIPFLLGL